MDQYAFESISYWDKDKKQPRSKRKPGHENQGMSEDVIICLPDTRQFSLPHCL